MIEIKNVTKKYGDKVALNDVSFCVNDGEIFGFIGPNGAGKTTLINRLIHEAYKGEKIVLIENEFGEIGIDGGFLAEAGIQINEMNSGCICCSLVGDFGKALQKVLDTYAPDRILIEPSGVGKLSDVVKAVSAVLSEKIRCSPWGDGSGTVPSSVQPRIS